MTRKPRWADAWGPPETSTRHRTTEAYWRKPFAWQKKAQERGEPYRVFCGSLCDVFEDNPQVIEWRLELFELIADTPDLRWLVLTKRPKIALDYFTWVGRVSDNIWLGVSAEDQATADERIPLLLQVPVAVRFVSAEPLLGEILLRRWVPPSCDWPDCGIHWLIVGGESGHNARSMHPDWARSLRDQCQDAGVPFFMKQMAKKAPIPDDLMVREYPQP